MFRLRLIRLLILWFFKPKSDLLARHELKLIAWPLIDVDVTRMMAHAFTRSMSLGRYQTVFASEFRDGALKGRLYPMTVAETLRIAKPIKAFERYTLTSQVVFWNDRRFFCEQRFVVKGQVRARCLVEGIIWGPNGKLSPREVFQLIGVTRESPAPTEEIRAWEKCSSLAQAAIKPASV